MGAIRITGPDGRTVRITPPEGATEDQIAAKIAEVKSTWQVEQGPAPPKTSGLGALASGLGQSFFNLGDEIEAGVRAAIDPNKTYDDYIPEVRQRLEDSAAEHPYAYYGGQIAGSVALPLGAAKVGLSAIDKAVKAKAGLGALVKAGAKEGAAYGAAYGAGGSEGDPTTLDGLQSRATGAGFGAATGATVGAAAPALMAGLSGAADKARSAVRTITKPMQQATDDVAKIAIADDAAADIVRQSGGKPLRLDENPVAQQMVDAGQAPDVRLIDTMGEKGKALLRAASNNSAEAREMANSVLMPRSQGQTERAMNFVRGLTGREGNAYKVGKDLAERKAKTLDPLYAVAREMGDRPIWNKNLEALTSSDTVRKAMMKASTAVDDRAVSHGYGAMNTGVSFENGVMRFTRGADKRASLPNLEFWDQTKRVIDDAVGAAKDAKQWDEVERLTGIQRRLRSELDSIVPQYKTARGTAAKFFDAEDALDAGKKMAAPGTKFDMNEAKDVLKAMTPEERDLFEEGFVSTYLDSISRQGDRSNLVTKLAGNPRDRELFALAMGPDKATKLEAFLHIENVMESAKNALGNSTTTRQLIEQNLLSGGASLGVGALSTGGDWTNPMTYVTAALVKWAPAKAGGALKERYALNITRLLMSPDPRLKQQAINELSKPENLNALRNLTKMMTAVGANAAGSMAAQKPPLTGSQMGQGIREDK